MPGMRPLKAGLTVAVAALLLTACVSRDDIASLDNRVGELERRANAAEARASQLESAANQCTATCQTAEERTQRMFEESMRK